MRFHPAGVVIRLGVRRTGFYGVRQLAAAVLCHSCRAFEGENSGTKLPHSTILSLMLT
jgi:hypothetical protein